jgi:4-amino-4-deoxy-L-arabinose transferase-like glycosyltransferase
MNSGKLSRLLLLPCLLLVVVTVPHLGQGDFRRDTGRYAAVGLYMWESGNWFKPYLNPEIPYFNKPPLAFWIHGAFLKAFGAQLAVARVTSILAALGVVILSVLTVRRLGSRSEALVSGMVLALTYEFWRRTREISLDFWQLFFVMAAVYLVITGARTGRKGLVVLGGVPIGLALLCKPLVALAVTPVLAIWLAMLGRGQWIWLLLGGTIPVAALTAFPWHLYMWCEFGDAFTNRYLVHEVVDRAQGRISTNPPLYYLQILGATYWPWLAALGFAIWHRWRGDRPRRRVSRDLVALGGVWAVYGLGLLSLFPDKKPNYALLVYPMLSWVAAAGLCRLPWRGLGQWYRGGFRWLAPAAALLLVLLSVAPIRFQAPPNQDWQSLFRWMDEQSIQPGQVVAFGMNPDDKCYFYIGRGGWPARDSAAVPYVLQRQAKDWVPNQNQAVLFRSGILVVTGSRPGSP